MQPFHASCSVLIALGGGLLLGCARPVRAVPSDALAGPPADARRSEPERTLPAASTSTPAPAGSGTRSSEADPVPVDPSRLRPLEPTAFAGQLRQLGLDPLALPSLSAIGAMQKLELMDWVAESLGVECTHCHVSDSDYRTDTPRKQVARQMWSEFVVGRRLGDDALFCDSCHRGSAQILLRAHERETKAYMKQQFGRIVRSEDASQLVCASCHGKPFQARIFESRWGASLDPIE